MPNDSVHYFCGNYVLLKPKLVDAGDGGGGASGATGEEQNLFPIQVEKWTIEPAAIPEFLHFDTAVGVLAGWIPEDLQFFQTLAAGDARYSQTFTVTAFCEWGKASRQLVLTISPKQGPLELNLLGHKVNVARKYHLGCKVRIQGPLTLKGTHPTSYSLDPLGKSPTTRHSLQSGVAKNQEKFAIVPTHTFTNYSYCLCWIF